MATRLVEYKIEAKGGLLLPASPEAGKVATSDASGNFEWAAIPKKKDYDEHSWAISGLVTAKTYPGFFVGKGTKKIVAISYHCTKGKVKFSIIEGASTKLTNFKELTAEEGVEKTDTPTAATPTENKLIRLEVETITTAPENLTVSIQIESEF